jgi:hypothetical protein
MPQFLQSLFKLQYAQQYSDLEAVIYLLKSVDDKGRLVTTLTKLSQAWRWTSKNTIKRFLEKLEAEEYLAGLEIKPTKENSLVILMDKDRVQADFMAFLGINSMIAINDGDAPEIETQAPKTNDIATVTLPVVVSEEPRKRGRGRNAKNTKEVVQLTIIGDIPTDAEAKVLFDNFCDAYRKYKPKINNRQKAWEDFKKKNKDYRFISTLLMPGLEKEVKFREAAAKINGYFVEGWKLITTWLNEGCWNAEYSELPTRTIKTISPQGVEVTKNITETEYRMRQEREEDLKRKQQEKQIIQREQEIERDKKRYQNNDNTRSKGINSISGLISNMVPQMPEHVKKNLHEQELANKRDSILKAFNTKAWVIDSSVWTNETDEVKIRELKLSAGWIASKKIPVEAYEILSAENKIDHAYWAKAETSAKQYILSQLENEYKGKGLQIGDINKMLQNSLSQRQSEIKTLARQLSVYHSMVSIVQQEGKK